MQRNSASEQDGYSSRDFEDLYLKLGPGSGLRLSKCSELNRERIGLQQSKLHLSTVHYWRDEVVKVGPQPPYTPSSFESVS